MKKRQVISLLLVFCLILPLVSCAPSESDEVSKHDSLATNLNITYTSDIPEEYADLSFPESADDGAKKAYRIFPWFWYEDEAWERTVAGLRKYADVVDEVTLFCDQFNAPYMTDEMLIDHCTILEKRIKDLRDMAVPSVGLNVLQTVGQGDYAVGSLPYPKMQTAVDHEGRTSATQLCHNSDEFREYTAKKYRMFAELDVDFIWVDDDFRAADGKTVVYTCFCDGCISKFNTLHGTNYNRNTLARKLDSYGSSEDVRDLRQKWSDFVVDSYAEVMALIDETVAAVNPEIELGLMIVHLNYSTYLLGRWQNLIDGLDAERVRPGGGVHDEYWPMGFLDKTISSARQVLQAEGAYDIQYEYEDFPQTHYKSPKSHILECTAALMAGCTGIAYASMPNIANDDVMRAIQDAAPMWDDIINTAGDWELYGGTFLWSEDAALYNNSFLAYTGSNFYTMLNLFSYGSSVSYTPLVENSVMTVISGSMAHTVTEEEIMTAFANGVLLDDSAATILTSRGYGYLLGTSSERVSCPWFGGYMCENSLGGRVAVLNALPGSGTVSTYTGDEKFDALVEWLSNGKNPLSVDTLRVASFIRQPEDRSEFMFMLINTTPDTTDDVTVSVLGEYNCDFVIYDENGTATAIPAENAVIENGRTILTLPGMTCWGFCVVRTA